MKLHPSNASWVTVVMHPTIVRNPLPQARRRVAEHRVDVAPDCGPKAAAVGFVDRAAGLAVLFRYRALYSSRVLIPAL